MIEELRITCPYCGADFDTSADCSAGSQDYVEDCHVCCRPIEFHLEVDPAFQLQNISVRRDDD